MGNGTIVCEICGGSGVIYLAADRDRARMCPQCDGTGFVPEPDNALTAAQARIAELEAALMDARKFLKTLPDGIGEVLNEHFVAAAEFWEWYDGLMMSVNEALE